MRPYLEIFRSGAVWTYTRPSQLLILVSSFSTALSSYDLPFENMTTRVLSARIALRTGFGQALEVLGGRGVGGAGLGLARLRLLRRRRRAGGGLPGIDSVDALLLRELAVGGVDGVLRRIAHLTGLGDGRPGRLDRRDLLGLGPEEKHVGAQHRDGEDEHDSDRRGDLAHDLAYRHASREG